MTVNPVDLQIILPQSGQVNKLNRGLQFQQQTEQQVLAQQVQASMRREEQQVKKTSNVENAKVDNEKKDHSQSDQYEPAQDNRQDAENEERELMESKGSLGNVLDIKV